jgi:hypothetical protein
MPVGVMPFLSRLPSAAPSASSAVAPLTASAFAAAVSPPAGQSAGAFVP